MGWFLTAVFAFLLLKSQLSIEQLLLTGLLFVIFYGVYKNNEVLRIMQENLNNKIDELKEEIEALKEINEEVEDDIL